MLKTMASTGALQQELLLLVTIGRQFSSKLRCLIPCRLLAEVDLLVEVQVVALSTLTMAAEVFVVDKDPCAFSVKKHLSLSFCSLKFLCELTLP